MNQGEGVTDAVGGLLEMAARILGDVLQIVETVAEKGKAPARQALIEQSIQEVWPEMQVLNARWRDAGHSNLFRLKLVLALLALMATEWRDAMAEENGSREEEDQWGRKESREEGEEHECRPDGGPGF